MPRWYRLECGWQPDSVLLLERTSKYNVWCGYVRSGQEQAVPDSTPVYATVLTCYNVGTGTATIQVSFVNNYTPQFALNLYDVIVLESATILSSVATVSAIDMDVGSYGQVTYSILAGNPNKFFINPETGDLGVLTPLNYEVTNTYNWQLMEVQPPALPKGELA